MAVEAAKEGQTFEYETYRGGKKNVKEAATVRPSCGGQRGAWFCITHGISFRNQFEKDTHISKGDHVLCWICLEHGAEVP